MKFPSLKIENNDLVDVLLFVRIVLGEKILIFENIKWYNKQK